MLDLRPVEVRSDQWRRLRSRRALGAAPAPPPLPQPPDVAKPELDRVGARPPWLRLGQRPDLRNGRRRLGQRGAQRRRWSVRSIARSIATSYNTTNSGWVAGGGMEFMATANWLVRVEYLHYKFGGGNTRSVACTLVRRWRLCRHRKLRLGQHDLGRGPGRPELQVLIHQTYPGRTGPGCARRGLFVGALIARIGSAER